MDKILIGGKDIEIKLKYKSVQKILNNYEQLAITEGMSIPDHFFFWAVWTVIVKRRCWPFRKPFRSIHVMVKELEIDEFEKLVGFVQERIFRIEPTGDGNSENV